MRLCLFAFAALAASFTAPAQTIQRDIPYTSDTSGSYKADLYQPTGPGTFPAIVYIHGGSWRSGDKKVYSKLAYDLAAKGYAGFSIDYDLQPHSWPLSLAESDAAVAYLRTHAAEYHLDPTRILVAGDSAGGQLAALVALDPANQITAGLMLNGVYDLTGNYGVIHRYLGGKCPDISTACKDASPMQQIHHGEPPFFIGHGTSDYTVPFASAQLFSHDMQAAGNPVTFFPAQGGHHGYWSTNKFYAANLTAIEQFLTTLH